MNDISFDDQVVIEEASWVSGIRKDSTDLGGGEEYNSYALFSHPLLDIGLAK